MLRSHHYDFSFISAEQNFLHRNESANAGAFGLFLQCPSSLPQGCRLKSTDPVKNALRCSSDDASSSAVPAPEAQHPKKQSWIISTQRNLGRKIIEQPSEACTRCLGTGERVCMECQGRGRTNYIHLVMLPKGEWPKWCSVCHGSGVVPCRTCSGTGRFIRMVGFQL